MLSNKADFAVLDLYWCNKFISSINSTLNDKFRKSTAGYSPIDQRQLQHLTVHEFKDQITSVEPKIIVNMMELFDDERHVSLIVQKTLDSLRSEEIDIRTFPLNQLSQFITYVATYEPHEVKVFFNYVMAAFESGYFKMTPGNFDQMSQIFVMFVKNGFLGPEKQTKFFYAFCLGLKQHLFPEIGVEKRLDSRHMIQITWSLITMQEAGELTIPLLPKMLEHLKYFDRPGQPLTEDELCMLHQIAVYVQDMVQKDRLPVQFASIIPADVRHMAASVWNM